MISLSDGGGSDARRGGSVVCVVCVVATLVFVIVVISGISNIIMKDNKLSFSLFFNVLFLYLLQLFDDLYKSWSFGGVGVPT